MKVQLKRGIFPACVLALACNMGAISAQDFPAKTAAIEGFAKGVQIYACRASGASYAWALKAPEATLRDAKGNVIATHFAGPAWEGTDGSTVIGEPLVASPSPDAAAIPWVILHARAHTWSGVMTNVAYVVRTRTQGGVAPATGCDVGHANAEVRVPYRAVYLFFRA